jgi:hypothetical protein
MPRLLVAPHWPKLHLRQLHLFQRYNGEQVSKSKVLRDVNPPEVLARDMNPSKVILTIKNYHFLCQDKIFHSTSWENLT